jgi:hypothetical protein
MSKLVDLARCRYVFYVDQPSGAPKDSIAKLQKDFEVRMQEFSGDWEWEDVHTIECDAEFHAIVWITQTIRSQDDFSMPTEFLDEVSEQQRSGVPMRLSRWQSKDLF